MISLNDVLLAMSNIPVDDPIAEIWGRGLQGGYKIIEYTGSLPITITANGDALLDYRIYGTDGGVGVATENLFDKNANDVNKGYVKYGYLTADGTVNTGIGSSSFSISEYISLPLESETIFLENVGTISAPGIAICFYDDRQVYISGRAYGAIDSLSVQKPSNAILCRVTFLKTRASIAYVGSTVPTNYIPYGYKLPMMVQSANLFDRTGEISPYYINKDGEIKQIAAAVQWFVSDFTPVQPNTTYTFTYNSIAGADGYHAFYNDNKELISTVHMRTFIFTTPNDAKYMRFTYRGDSFDIMLNLGSTALPYEPYSHTDIPVYIGENQLDAGEYVSYGEQKIYRDVDGTLTPTDPPVSLPQIPTIDGTTIIDYDGDPKPSQMYVKYKSKG